MSVRVVMVISALQTGGAERNLAGLIPHLRDRGLEVTVATVTDRTEPDVRDAFIASGAPHVSLHARRTFDPAAIRRMRLLARRFDVVHAHDQQSQIVTALALLATPVPLVFTRHVVVDNVDDLRRRFLGVISAALAHRAHRYIAVSEAVATEFRRRHRYGHPPITTVHNGIDLDAYPDPADRDEARSELGWESETQIATMVAVMRPVKAHDQLIEAAIQLEHELPELRIVLVGTGPLEARLRDLAAPVGNRVVFMGQRSDVPTILAASDVAVLATHREGLPIVLLEAGAAGVPAVASDVGGVPEVVLHGATGILTAPQDPADLARALGELMGEPEERERMGRAARERVASHFSYPAQAAATRSVYEEVLA